MVGTSRPVYHNRFIIPRSTIATETRKHPSPSNHIVCPTRLADERGYSVVILLALEETRQVRRCSAARRHEILSQTRDIRRTPTIIDTDIVDRHRDTPTPPVSVFSASPRARARKLPPKSSSVAELFDLNRKSRDFRCSAQRKQIDRALPGAATPLRATWFQHYTARSIHTYIRRAHRPTQANVGPGIPPALISAYRHSAVQRWANLHEHNATKRLTVR